MMKASARNEENNKRGTKSKLDIMKTLSRRWLNMATTRKIRRMFGFYIQSVDDKQTVSLRFLFVFQERFKVTDFLLRLFQVLLRLRSCLVHAFQRYFQLCNILLQSLADYDTFHLEPSLGFQILIDCIYCSLMHLTTSTQAKMVRLRW